MSGVATGSGRGGGGRNKCCAGGITVLYWWLSVFLDVMQQGLPGFAEVEFPISVNVIWMRNVGF